MVGGVGVVWSFMCVDMLIWKMYVLGGGRSVASSVFYVVWDEVRRWSVVSGFMCDYYRTSSAAGRC